MTEAPASSASPNHTYGATGDYTVTLTVTDNQGATNVASRSIHVTNSAPTAAFTTSTNGVTVSVNAAGSSDPDGTIASYDWNWGDGSAHSTGAAPSHVYATGTYTITLTVTDNAGGTGTVTHQVTPAANQAPHAVYTDTEAGLKASFDATGSSDPDGTIASYAWDFGDGGTSTAVKPNHTYNAAGDYTVALTVTDNQGSTDVSSRSIHVTNSAPNAVVRHDHQRAERLGRRHGLERSRRHHRLLRLELGGRLGPQHGCDPEPHRTPWGPTR